MANNPRQTNQTWRERWKGGRIHWWQEWSASWEPHKRFEIRGIADATQVPAVFSEWLINVRSDGSQMGLLYAENDPMGELINELRHLQGLPILERGWVTSATMVSADSIQSGYILYGLADDRQLGLTDNDDIERGIKLLKELISKRLGSATVMESVFDQNYEALFELCGSSDVQTAADRCRSWLQSQDFSLRPLFEQGWITPAKVVYRNRVQDGWILRAQLNARTSDSAEYLKRRIASLRNFLTTMGESTLLGFGKDYVYETQLMGNLKKPADLDIVARSAIAKSARWVEYVPGDMVVLGCVSPITMMAKDPAESESGWTFHAVVPIASGQYDSEERDTNRAAVGSIVTSIHTSLSLPWIWQAQTMRVVPTLYRLRLDNDDSELQMPNLSGQYMHQSDAWRWRKLQLEDIGDLERELKRTRHLLNLILADLRRARLKIADPKAKKFFRWSNIKKLKTTVFPASYDGDQSDAASAAYNAQRAATALEALNSIKRRTVRRPRLFGNNSL